MCGRSALSFAQLLSSTPAEESDAQFRALLAAATAAFGAADATALATELGIAQQAHEIGNRYHADEKLQAAANDVAIVLARK